MNRRIKHGILLLVGLVLVGATVYVPMLSVNSSQMKSVSFGYPLRFVSQDFSDYDASFSYFPRYQKAELFKRPIHGFNPFNFIFSWVIIFIILEVVIYVLEWLKYKITGVIQFFRHDAAPPLAL